MKQHKNILMSHSPSKGKIVDPLVKKVDRIGVSLQALVSSLTLPFKSNPNASSKLMLMINSLVYLGCRIEPLAGVASAAGPTQS